MSILGNCFEIPKKVEGSTILAGSQTDWQITEIEIYHIGLI